MVYLRTKSILRVATSASAAVMQHARGYSAINQNRTNIIIYYFGNRIKSFLVNFAVKKTCPVRVAKWARFSAKGPGTHCLALRQVSRLLAETGQSCIWISFVHLRRTPASIATNHLSACVQHVQTNVKSADLVQNCFLGSLPAFVLIVENTLRLGALMTDGWKTKQSRSSSLEP